MQQNKILKLKFINFTISFIPYKSIIHWHNCNCCNEKYKYYFWNFPCNYYCFLYLVELKIYIIAAILSIHIWPLSLLNKIEQVSAYVCKYSSSEWAACRTHRMQPRCTDREPRSIWTQVRNWTERLVSLFLILSFFLFQQLLLV